MGIDQSMFAYQPPDNHHWNWPSTQLYKNYCCMLLKDHMTMGLYYAKNNTVHFSKTVIKNSTIWPLKRESHLNKQRIMIAVVFRPG